MKITWDIGPVAHRALHSIDRGIVENSPSAVAAALEENLAIEVDIQLSRDETPMVFHDFTLDRLIDDRGTVKSRTVDELVTLGYRTGSDRIITLDALFEMVDGRVPLYIELKSDFSGDMALPHAVAPMINAYAGPAALMSFDPWMVNACRQLCPRIPCGLVSGTFATANWDPHAGNALLRFALRHMLTAAIARPTFINYDISAVDAAAPQLFRRFGVPLLTWTVRTPEQRAAATRWTDAMVFEGFIPTVQERTFKQS